MKDVMNSSKKNIGQDNTFQYYGEVENVCEYVSSTYGEGWVESESSFIRNTDSFFEDELERDNLNGTITSISRIMKYYRNIGYLSIPENLNEIYEVIHDIGLKHNNSPAKSNIIRELFVFSSGPFDNMVRDVWKVFGYTKGSVINIYYGKLKMIIKSINTLNPVLLNITVGASKSHTVTVLGYTIFSKAGARDKIFVKIFDVLNNIERYIDWTKFGKIPASVTRFYPPVEK